MSLQEAAANGVRKEWQKYKNVVPESLFQVIWNAWCKKHDIKEFSYGTDKYLGFVSISSDASLQDVMSELYIVVLRRFIDNTLVDQHIKLKGRGLLVVVRPHTLILKSVDAEQRKEIHQLCDKLGLHHQSKVIKIKKGKIKKHLHIYKPRDWAWEYSAPNPYSEAPEVYAEREATREAAHERWKARALHIYCYGCSTTAYDVGGQLYRARYDNELYCQTCMDTEQTEDGSSLIDYDYDPIEYI